MIPSNLFVDRKSNVDCFAMAAYTAYLNSILISTRSSYSHKGTDNELHTTSIHMSR